VPRLHPSLQASRSTDSSRRSCMIFASLPLVACASVKFQFACLGRAARPPLVPACAIATMIEAVICFSILYESLQVKPSLILELPD
jgi:hypothetical protein